MRYFKWPLGVLLLAALPVMALINVTNTQRFTTNVGEHESIHGSLYSSGKTVTIRGTIDGDVFCAGQTVLVNAVVNGDVICAGRDVTVSGRVSGDVRLAGQSVAIDALVNHNASVAAMNFSLDVDARIGGDLSAFGDSHNIKGRVGRDIVATGNTIILNGRVGRNVTASAPLVQLRRDAHIGQNFTYTSSRTAEIDRGATVQGKTTRHHPTKRGRNMLSTFSLMLYAFVLCGMLLVGLLLALLFPRFMRRTTDHIKSGFPRSFVVGLLASIVVPALIALLFVTIVGIPLALALALAWLLASVLAGPIAGYYTGRLVLRDKVRVPAVIILVGGIITATIFFIPYLGILILMLAYWVGIGGLVLTLREGTGRHGPGESEVASASP